jgi:predicted unusual protein kinase regulating ubiquinone biosynthesis (AarF/ABC1/UbiB family)
MMRPVPDDPKLPQGRLSRFAKLAALGAKAGTNLLRDKTGELAAKQTAEVLGSMRGLAAKAGQMASYVDGVVPPGQREAFEGALAKLRNATPKSSYADVKRIVETDLGAPLDTLFAEFDETPLASASIGQVHRAVVRGIDAARDLEVAVKVQHAGIHEAVESDLANASSLGILKGVMLGKQFKIDRVIDEVKRTFRAELDYRNEATHQRWFTEFHADDPKVHIPRVVAERSSARVLTTELIRGKSFEEACALPEHDRAKYAETMWRFVFRGLLVGGRFNADPHPGNYFFHDDGRVTFLDFGCVVTSPDVRMRSARAAHRGAIDGDREAFRAGIRTLLELRGGAYEDTALSYVERAYAPMFESPYRITREYAGSMVAGMVETAQSARKTERSEFVPMPEGMVFMNRLQFGFYSVLARLDCAVDYAGIEREFLAGTD